MDVNFIIIIDPYYGYPTTYVTPYGCYGNRYYRNPRIIPAYGMYHYGGLGYHRGCGGFPVGYGGFQRGHC
jgi:hypothetical protein